MHSRIIRSLVFAVAISILAVPALGQETLPYPRLANVYLAGSVTSEAITQLAKWDAVVLSSVWADSQLAALRALNPAIKIYLYSCHYCVNVPPAAANLWEQQVYNYVATNDLWWYNRYGVPASGGTVALRVYNVKGQLVRTLADGAAREACRRALTLARSANT